MVEDSASGEEEGLRRAISRAPTSVQAHADLCAHLCQTGRCDEALTLLDEVWANRPDALWALSLKAAVLDTARRTEDALAVHEALIARAPHASVPWLNYGHALKVVGRSAEAVDAYRRALALDPDNGLAWWGLADLRTVQLHADDVTAMDVALDRAGDDLSRIQLHFALGKALGDLGRFEPSFRHYEMANDLRSRIVPYHAGDVRKLISQIEAAFTPGVFSTSGEDARDVPELIFIVGMPRAGSSLVEQILASHPMVEGLGELFELSELAARIDASSASGWPNAIAAMSTDECAALGRAHLASIRRYARTNRPIIIDKMPSNWRYLGLIRRILPNARIIDVRRHPVACCLSMFTTYFNRRTRVPTSLPDLGHHYRDYVRTIGHFEALEPGRIHRVQYEHLIEDLEGEVRRLLACLGLPFDPACLRFHENPRAVHTPSAQQVRRPINRDGLERWRNYRPWLGSLEDALGEAGKAVN